MAKKVAKRGRGRPRKDGLAVGSKTKAAKKRSGAKAARSSTKALSRRPVVNDLVAGKYVIAGPAGILEKTPMASHGDAASGNGHAGEAPTPIFSTEADNRPVSTYAVFDDKEEAELELDLLKRGGQRADALDVALGLVPESGVHVPETDPALVGAEVRPMKEFFATSYEIEVNNELTRTVTWRDKATPLREAVGSVRGELKDQLSVHEAALKEFDRRVAEARRGNEMDVRKAAMMLEKFNRAAETYA